MADKLLLILISSVILPDIFIYKMMVMQITQKRKFRLLYFLPSVIILLGILFLKFGNDKFIAENDFVINRGLFIAFLFIIPKLIFFIFSIADLFIKFVFRWPVSVFDILSILLPIACVGIMIYGSVFGKNKYTLKEITYSSTSLPESFEGYKIVQLSDLHLGSFKGKQKEIKKIVELVNDQKPDLIVFTGDLINRRAEEIDEFKKILMTLRAKDGVYSILGNHDYCKFFPWDGPWQAEADFEILKEHQAWMGWYLLNNEHAYLYRKNDSIALVGIENWDLPPSEGKGNLKKAIEGINYGDFKILLTHNPTHWKAEVLPLTNIALTLSGHTHAMQFKIGSFSPSMWRYDEWAGLYTENSQSMYVNVGIGYIGIPFRFGAWPEITSIILKRGEQIH